MEKKQACHIEWGRLQMTGQKTPVVTGAAFGPESFMWIACSTSKCLVHVFQDARLQSVWRFPSDPVYLLLCSSRRPEIPFPSKRNSSNARSYITLLVGTLDGGVWQMDLSTNYLRSPQRPSKKRKDVTSDTEMDYSLDFESKKLATKSREEGGVFDFPERTSVLERRPNHDGGDSFAHAWVKDAAAVGDDNDRQHSNFYGLKYRWVKQGVHIQRNITRKCPVNAVSLADLLNTGPPVSVAAFGPNDTVALLSPDGALDIMSLSRSRSTKRTSVACFGETSTKRPKSTCILFASKQIEEGSLPLEGTLASLSASLFRNIFGETDKAFEGVGLLQGDENGGVHAVTLDATLTVARSPAGMLCNLEQPIAAMLIVPFNGVPTRASPYTLREDQSAGDLILILGQQGRAILLTSVQDKVNESTESPFLFSRRRFFDERKSTAAIQLANRFLAFQEWDLNSPITSACMLGDGRLCYCTGSDIMYVDLFETLGPGTIRSKTANAAYQTKFANSNLLSRSQPAICNSSDKQGGPRKPSWRWAPKGKLVSHAVPVSDVVVAIVGRGALTVPGGSRPVVAVTSQGRILGVEMTDHVSSPVLNEVDDQLSWKPLPSRKEERVQNLLQSISEVAGRRAAINRHHSILTSVLKDLADTFPLAYDVCHGSERHKICFRELPSPGLSPPCKLYCSLSVCNHPNEIYQQECSVLRPALYASCGRPDTLVKLSVLLRNLSSLTLSPSWNLVVSLRHLHSESYKSSSFSTVINRGLGLAVDSCSTHEFQIRLSSTGGLPLLASIFICRLSDAHEATLGCKFGSNRFGEIKRKQAHEKVVNDVSSKAAGPKRLMQLGGEDSQRCLTSDSLTSENPGFVCLSLGHSRIDVISRLEK